MKLNSIWANEEFTKRESMSKTLTFQLIPTQATKDALEKDNIHKKDKEIYALKDALIPHMDVFYRKKINECLEEADLDFNKLHTLYINRDESGEAENAYKEALETYTEQLAAHMSGQCAKLYDYAFISKTFPAFVNDNRELFENPEEVLGMVEQTKGLGCVFTSYFLSREAILTGTKKNSVAFRVIRENFPVYAANIRKFERIMKEAPEEVDNTEKSLGISIKEAFVAENFGRYMGQEGIDRYNLILGGIAELEKKTKKGLNAIIHEHNQREKADGNHAFLPKMEPLAKQILSMRGAAFSYTGFETDQEFMHQILQLKESVEESGALTNTVRLFSRFDYMQKDGIYISPGQAEKVANQITKDYAFFKEYVIDDLTDSVLAEKGKKTLTKAELSSIKIRAGKVYVSVHDLERYLTDAIKTGRVTEYSHKDISTYLTEKVIDLATDVKRYGEIFDREDYKADTFRVTSKAKKVIKDYLDALLELNRFVRGFNADLSDKEIIETEFYDTLDDIVESMNTVTLIYNRARNYLTRKPKDMSKKVQTCLGKSQLLLEGWVTEDKNLLKKTNQCILRRDGIYYYGTFSDNAHKKSQLEILEERPDSPCFEKINVMSITKAYMNIPRVTFVKEIKKYFESGETAPYVRTEGVTEPFAISREIYDIYTGKRYLKGFYDKEKNEEEKNKKYRIFRENLNKMIQFYTDFLKVFYKTKDYDLDRLKDPDSYETIADFFADCEKNLTKMCCGYIVADQIEELELSGAFYLFKIYSQTLYGKNNKNYFAKYLDFLFSDENMKNRQIELNGAPMVQYRAAALEKRITHPAGSKVLNKKDKFGDPVPEDIYSELYAFYTGKRDSVSLDAKRYMDKVIVHKTAQDLIKDKRYTKEMYILNIAVTVNFDAVTKNARLNDCVNAYIQSGACNILSVTRGERDLLYYMLSDMKGTILKQGSLNKIDGFDYHKKLYYLTREKKDDQRNWNEIKKSAGIKEGYLSRAITEIVWLALKYNAVIAIEGLTEGFKDKRSCLDNQVYKKFESMLLERLSCLHLQNIDPSEPGGVANPLQLVDASKPNATANGILIKINPAYTASMCPVTGFVNLFDLRNYTTVKAKREFLGKMDEIYFDSGRGVFVFRFHYSNMGTLKAPYARDEWIINTSGNRFFKGKDGWLEYDITGELAAALCKCNIPYKNGESLLEAVHSDATGSKFINALMDAFTYTMQNKNYPNGFEHSASYHSPAENEEGECFDTQDAYENMPQCAEAVKAYNLTDILLLSISAKEKSQEKRLVIIKAEDWIKRRQCKE